jgi:hypothetical protein
MFLIPTRFHGSPGQRLGKPSHNSLDPVKIVRAAAALQDFIQNLF